MAELAFALILALDRRIADNVISLREGHWNKTEYSKARGLFGRTLGLIGLGQIGREMIPRARGFGMPVVAWSRSLTPETAEQLRIEYKSSLENVASASDIVSVHVALNAQTRGLIGAKFFERMRPGAYFINTSRAEVVDQDALSRALREKGIRAGLDVFDKEPAGGTGEFADEIVKAGLVYGTHHIGASTDQAQEAIAAETVRIVKAFRGNGKSAERGESGQSDAGHLRAGGAASGSSGSAGRAFWMPSARPASMCRRWRTSSLRGRRRRWRGLIWRRNRARRCWKRIRASNPDILEIGLIRLVEKIGRRKDLPVHVGHGSDAGPSCRRMPGR